MLGIIPAYHGIYTEGMHTVKRCEEDNIEFTPAEFTPVQDPRKGRQGGQQGRQAHPQGRRQEEAQESTSYVESRSSSMGK